MFKTGKSSALIFRGGVMIRVINESDWIIF